MKFYLVLFMTLMLIVSCGEFKGDRGPAGPMGPAGPAGSDAELNLIELCPGIAGTGLHEYVLKTETAIFAVYYDKNHTFLTRLIPGKYITTDGRNCKFTVTSDYELAYE